MANYDRRFLVPYLQNICSMELICSKLEKELVQSNNRIKQLQGSLNAKLTKPSYPQKGEKKAELANNIPPIIIGVLIALAGLLWILCIKVLWLIGAAGIAFGALFIFTGAAEIAEEKRKVAEYYSERKLGYERAMKEYNSKVAALPKTGQALENAKNENVRIGRELSKARTVRKDLYSVNIIPNQYRNLYAAYYLYEFISSGRETDLEKVIQTFVLEEIKRRLDVVISQNQQILVNQRIQIAMQEHQNRTIAENHRNQMRQFARMERNMELQNDYLQMIEKDQQLTNYILVADYVRKYYL